MEDRKRGLEVEDEPQRKKVLVAQEAGGPITLEDIDQFRKEAIFRQMIQYKREKDSLESELDQVKQRYSLLESAFALLDNWWDHLIALFPDPAVSAGANGAYDQELLSSLLFDNSVGLDKLEKKNNIIKERVQGVLAKLNIEHGSTSDAESLVAIAQQLHKVRSENEVLRASQTELEQRINDINIKYASLCKQMDRATCPSVTRVLGGYAGGGSGAGGAAAAATSSTPAGKENESSRSAEQNGTEKKPIEKDLSNGEKTANGDTTASLSELQTKLDDVELQLSQSQGVVQQQQIQITSQQASIRSLQDKISDLTQRLSDPPESDLESCSFVRSLKLRNQNLVSQLESLQIAHKALQEEKSKLVVGQEEYEAKVRREYMNKTQSIQQQLVKAEQDVARIRAARDDLLSDLNIKKSTEAERKHAFEELNQLVSIRDSRIKTLENEVARFKSQVEESGNDANNVDLDAMTNNNETNNTDDTITTTNDTDSLKKLAQKLQRQNKSLLAEIPSLEQAFAQAHAKATAKVNDAVEQEARMNKFKAEKVRADEKYFGAMRAKDQLAAENHSLKSQLTKSAEVIQQLKDVEDAKVRQITSLTSQLEELRKKQANFEAEVRANIQKAKEKEYRVESAQRSIDRLRDELRAKDSSISKEIDSRHALEIEIEKLKRQVDAKRMTTAAVSGSSSDLAEQLEALRSIAICSLCSKNWKDTAIKVCGHVFCNDCAKDRLNARLRKCPMCNKQYSFNDLLPVHL